jgi:hypothetical protein
MNIFGIGIPSSDVVGVATDVLSTNTQKETSARVKQELDAREVAVATPEVSVRDRVRLGANAPDYSAGFAPSNAAAFTSGVPLKG